MVCQAGGFRKFQVGEGAVSRSSDYSRHFELTSPPAAHKLGQLATRLAGKMERAERDAFRSFRWRDSVEERKQEMNPDLCFQALLHRTNALLRLSLSHSRLLRSIAAFLTLLNLLRARRPSQPAALVPMPLAGARALGRSRSLGRGSLALLNVAVLCVFTWRVGLLSSTAAGLYGLMGSVGVGAVVSAYMGLSFRTPGITGWMLIVLLVQTIAGAVLMGILS